MNEYIRDKRANQTGLSAPYVVRDTPAYRSPVTGEVIEGRAARREDLARHGCREIDPTENKREYRNDKYRIANWNDERKRKDGQLPARDGF